jgi:hypothetical protein
MPFDGQAGNRYEALARIDEVIRLLSRKEQWCKQQLRTRDGKRCIQGALMAANATTLLGEPILVAIRQVTGRDYARIEMFNDQPLTTHALVLEVLQRARRNLLDDVAERGSRPTITEQVGPRGSPPGCFGLLRRLADRAVVRAG